MKITLFCQAGMSTSLLVTKMKKAAEERGLETEIIAYSSSEMEKETPSSTVVLLGPQLGYMLKNAKKFADPLNIPVGIIPPQFYGMMDGNKVIDYALSLLK